MNCLPFFATCSHYAINRVSILATFAHAKRLTTKETNEREAIKTKSKRQSGFISITMKCLRCIQRQIVGSLCLISATETDVFCSTVLETETGRDKKKCWYCRSVDSNKRPTTPHWIDRVINIWKSSSIENMFRRMYLFVDQNSFQVNLNVEMYAIS